METISLFDMRLESFVRKYEKRYPEVIKYIYENRFLGNSQGGFVECWQQMHMKHKSQLVTIKEKFQQSMTFIKHEHNIDDFKGLHHHVSQYALNFIISEIKRSEKTHNLPCAHMIYEYQNHSKPIPLSSIGSQWRQINLNPHVSFNELVENFITELAQPDMNTFQEPPAPVRTKGRKIAVPPVEQGSTQNQE
ncbi:hypothetical protein MKX01_017055 [Papaver californicum]|nr:hypothetical protein MKX01_017055 [Papaver californicum]